MRKLIFILGIFAFIASSCKQTATAQIETLDVVEETNHDVIEEEDSDFLLEKILKQLHISAKERELELITQKELPYMKGNSVFVIPKIVNGDEYDVEIFDVYVLIVENETGKIIRNFYEKEGLVSDAVHLENIEIDTAPYRLNSETRAFGVRVNYRGSSRSNPYSSEEISLFIPRGDSSLARVLKDYKIAGFGGEWDTNCEGAFTETKSVLIMSNQQTCGFYNIEVKSTITDTVNELTEENDCDYEETVEYDSQILRYIDGEYK